MLTTNKTYADGTCVTEIFGLSDDEKPTNVSNSSIFYEMDTGTLYLFDEQNKVWLKQGEE